MTQAHIHFSGMVQGVGFRYTVHQIALDLGLSGWVRNLRDGRVEALIQGTQEDITRFCQNIEERFEGYIQEKEIIFEQIQEQMKSFDIAPTA